MRVEECRSLTLSSLSHSKVQVKSSYCLFNLLQIFVQSTRTQGVK